MNTINLIKNPEANLAAKSNRLAPFIGGTPLYHVTNINRNEKVRIFAKLEWQQFGGSVKARPAYRIIKDAIHQGALIPGKRLLDASSGNTGIAYAHIGAALGIPVTLCLPENATNERKRILRALGVDLRLTSMTGTTDEAQEIARQLFEDDPDTYFFADQYGNESNWKAHYDTTGPEILEQSEYGVTHFIAGLGTTGTVVGTGRRLKEYDPDIRVIALQPDLPMHGLEGWKHLETALVPGIYDDTLPDEIRSIGTETAHETIKLAASREGLLLSPSSAANLAAALQLADELEEGTVVTVFPDDGSKYGEVMNHLFNKT